MVFKLFCCLDVGINILNFLGRKKFAYSFCFKDKSKNKRQKNIDRHGPRPTPKVCHLSYPPLIPNTVRLPLILFSYDGHMNLTLKSCRPTSGPFPLPPPLQPYTATNIV